METLLLPSSDDRTKKIIVPIQRWLKEVSTYNIVLKVQSRFWKMPTCKYNVVGFIVSFLLPLLGLCLSGPCCICDVCHSLRLLKCPYAPLAAFSNTRKLK
jgi:hypothetical protein